MALLAGAVSYGAMSFIMTATPIQLHQVEGYNLDQTAWVIQSHIMAMFFALSVYGDAAGAAGGAARYADWRGSSVWVRGCRRYGSRIVPLLGRTGPFGRRVESVICWCDIAADAKLPTCRALQDPGGQ